MISVHKAISYSRVLLPLALLLVAGSPSGFAAESPSRVLRTAAEVRGLSAAEADQHLPVKLRGVVTFYDDALFSRFVQDATAGIYLLELTNSPALSPGQLVEVEGTAEPGEYAPVIQPTSVKVVGEAKIPAAKPVTLEELVSGQYDGQLVEFSGIVRAVLFDTLSQYYFVDFAKGKERFTVYAKQLPLARAEDMVESTVKVRGVCSTMFNHQRQLFGVRLLTPKADGLVIEAPAPANPFDQPVHPIRSLLQFAPEGTFGGRVKVSGTVAFGVPGNALYVQDEQSGLYCQTLQGDVLKPGDRVEVLGFPARGEYTPILEDAIYRKIGAGDAPKPHVTGVNEILTGVLDCRLVQLPARVLDRVDRGLNQFLLLQAGDFTFQAYLPQRVNAAEFDHLQNGSQVMATGICRIERGNQWQAGTEWRAASFYLLLRSPEDVAVLQSPTRFEWPEQTSVAVVCGVVAVGALAWVASLKRKVRLQSRLIQQP